MRARFCRAHRVSGRFPPNNVPLPWLLSLAHRYRCTPPSLPPPPPFHPPPATVKRKVRDKGQLLHTLEFDMDETWEDVSLTFDDGKPRWRPIRR